jgi:hypothetical protein
MSDWFSYEKKKRFDSSGRRWHFVYHELGDDALPNDDRPYELLFRSDDRSEFGRIRFERRKDNPYRDYDALVSKIMTDSEFRRSLSAPETKELWRRSWK